MWQRMNNPTGLDGKKDAPVIVYVFADPFCPYCKQFWQQAAPEGRFWQSAIKNIVGWGYQARKPGDSSGNSCLQRSRKTSGNNMVWWQA